MSVVVLVGAATAAAGPIGFVGLTVTHVARAITGPDHRWILLYSAVLAPILPLGSDIIGRIIARPGEVQVGSLQRKPRERTFGRNDDETEMTVEQRR